MQFVKIIIAISAFMLVAGCEDMATSTSTASATSTESGTFSESGNNTACDVCRSDETLELRWVADNMNVVGYKIYYSSEPYISERELTELDSSTTDFDLRNGTAFQAGKQDATQAVSDRGTKSTLERLCEELAVTGRERIRVAIDSTRKF